MRLFCTLFLSRQLNPCYIKLMSNSMNHWKLIRVWLLHNRLTSLQRNFEIRNHHAIRTALICMIFGTNFLLQLPPQRIWFLGLYSRCYDFFFLPICVFIFIRFTHFFFSLFFVFVDARTSCWQQQKKTEPRKDGKNDGARSRKRKT